MEIKVEFEFGKKACKYERRCSILFDSKRIYHAVKYAKIIIIILIITIIISLRRWTSAKCMFSFLRFACGHLMCRCLRVALPCLVLLKCKSKISKMNAQRKPTQNGWKSKPIGNYMPFVLEHANFKCDKNNGHSITSRKWLLLRFKENAREKKIPTKTRKKRFVFVCVYIV